MRAEIEGGGAGGVVERIRRVAESERPRDYCVSGGS